MSATIKVFCVGTRCFKHVMNTRNGTVELQDEHGVILLVFDADAKVRNQGGLMGVFVNEIADGRMRWRYYGDSIQEGADFGPDLRTAEVAVSRNYVSQLE